MSFIDDALAFDSFYKPDPEHGLATAQVRIEGTFAVKPGQRFRYTQWDARDTIYGPGEEWLDLGYDVRLPMGEGNWMSHFDESDLHSDDYEGLRLGDVYGLKIRCASNTCRNRAIRHHQPPPVAAVLMMTCSYSWERFPQVRPGIFAGTDTRSRLVHYTAFYLVAPSAKRRETLGASRAAFRIHWLPDDLRCQRCGRRGRVVSATPLTIDGRPAILPSERP